MFDFSGNVTVPDWGINIGWGGYPPYYGGSYPSYPLPTGGVYYPPRDNSQIIMIGLVVLAVVLLSK